MSTTYYFQQFNNEILLKVREWDGVGKAGHSLVDSISLPWAKGMLKELESAIKDAEEYEKTLSERREKELEQEIQQKQSELEALRKKKQFDLNKSLGLVETDDDYTPI